MIEIHNLESQQDFYPLFAKAYRSYEELLYQNNKIDFAYLQKIFYELLNHPDVYKKIKLGIKYIMLDEYQDYIQKQILVKLAHPENNLYVAGDKDQTIYRFCAETVRNILEFPVVFVGFLNKNFLVQKEEDGYLLPFSKRGAFEKEEQMNQFVQIRHYYVAFSRAQNLLVLKTSGNPNDCFEPNFSLVSLMNQSFRSNTHFPKKLFRFPRKKTKRCFNGIFLHEKEIKKITEL